MVELGDTYDLGSYAERYAGSSPAGDIWVLVVEWQTRMAKDHVPRGLQVRILSGTCWNSILKSSRRMLFFEFGRESYGEIFCNIEKK